LPRDSSARAAKNSPEFIRIAKASNGEARSILYAAADRGYVQNDEFRSLMSMNVSIAKMLRSLHRSLTTPQERSGTANPPSTTNQAPGTRRKEPP
jgi:hypothetical protein